MKRAWIVLSAALVGACGGSGGGAPPSASGPQILVAGAYEIRKTVVSDTCGQFTPGNTISNPAEVRHAAGASTFVLNDHGTRDIQGTLNRDGTFTMVSQSGLVMGTIAATDTWDSGRFSTSGFDVRNTTDLASTPGGGPACRSILMWAATKQGSPNVIP